MRPLPPVVLVTLLLLMQFGVVWVTGATVTVEPKRRGASVVTVDSLVPEPPLLVATPTQTAVAPPTTSPEAPLENRPATAPDEVQWRWFRLGYRDYNGNPEWEDHFVYHVLPCESSHWGGWYPNGYISKAQFHPGSWAKASNATGRFSPTNPYDVGANVAWWSNAIEHPGGSGGWGGLDGEGCWWR